ncbi:S9 family peptidase [Aerophototrophica crusticola]|uniref:S9 family peptidase n=1 Tax=Aerophototrophica crusticola TaxID=1709002 RepID=A0A858RAV9_9PROT|nr:S9 family peptidase [Rhodospirillaceae bacterium B3]
MQDDLNDGVKWAADQGIADAKRVCVLGWSYGGYAALMGAARDSNLFRCAVATAPVANIPRLYDEIGWSAFKNTARGNFFNDNDPEGLKRSSPYHRADGVNIPLLIIHGDKDVQAFVQHSRDMIDALKKSNKNFEYIEIPNMDHAPSTMQEHLQILTAWEKFLKVHLPAS